MSDDQSWFATDEQAGDAAEQPSDEGLYGGLSRGDAPTSFPGDTDAETAPAASESSLTEHLAEHIVSHVIGDVVGETIEMGAGAVPMSFAFGMERDTPQDPETVRMEEEEAARRAEFAREHPGTDDEPDASVPDATTQ